MEEQSFASLRRTTGVKIGRLCHHVRTAPAMVGGRWNTTVNRVAVLAIMPSHSETFLFVNLDGQILTKH